MNTCFYDPDTEYFPLVLIYTAYYEGIMLMFDHVCMVLIPKENRINS